MHQDSAIDFILEREGGDGDLAGLDAGDAMPGFPEEVSDARRGTRRKVSTYMRSGRGPCALDIYFRDLGRWSTLDDKKEQLELARRIRAAKKARMTEEVGRLEAEFLSRQLRIGVSIATRTLRGGGVEIEDRIQDGNIGLMRAVQKFDPDKGCTFFTFAKWRTLRAIQRGDEEDGRTIRLPSNIVRDLHRLDRAVREYERKFGKTPTTEEIAQCMGVAIGRVKKLLAVKSEEALTILDAIEPGEREALRHRSLGDTSAPTPEDLAIKKDTAEKLDTAVGRLDDTSAEVIRLFFGLRTGVPLTDCEVATKMGITEWVATSLRRKALKTLKGMEEVSNLWEMG